MMTGHKVRSAVLAASALTACTSLSSPALAGQAEKIATATDGPDARIALSMVPTVNAKPKDPIAITPDPGSVDHPARPLSDASPLWGNIRTFWGDTSPLWGNIRTFWGDVGPFSGDLSPFWGNIRTFNTTSSNALYPAWGNIRTFSEEIGGSWNGIRTSWSGLGSYESSPEGYADLAQQIQKMASLSNATFGAPILRQTGKTFTVGFMNPLFAKYNIKLNDPRTLAALDESAREHFFIEWWDGLMNYTGSDHIDHWMQSVNWTPALTQNLGAGKKTVIGLLDFSVTGDDANSVVKYSGVSDFANGHGSAVASLMISAHDGKGVMGIAPGASVVAFNPFDDSQTASWSDITDGVVMLAAQNKASVVNMSLGVPGWTLNEGWNHVFSDDKLNKILTNTVFVIAAGNDGVTQTQNIIWDKHNPALLVVGSVDPTGKISSFSNRPGTTCLLDDTKCKGDYLMNHFVVAPGEMILVSDGQGGVTRMSGTSFAAPLVAGTIALIQTRWPWLTSRPNDIVNIITKSARDLGAPGVDPVYGYGELDVLAAMSPLDWSKLTFKMTRNGVTTSVNATGLRSTSAASRATWEADGVYFSLFEATPSGSNRDFQVPMSSKLANQTVLVNGSAEQFMGYLTSRFTTWLGPAPKLTGDIAPMGFTDLGGASERLRLSGDLEARVTMRPRVNQLGFRPSGVPFQTDFHVVSADRSFAFGFGNGDGAAAIGGQTGFGMTSDYDVEQGGANPFLGFASGGGYARVELALAPGLSIASAVSERTLRRDPNSLLPEQRAFWRGQYDYGAHAANLSVSYDTGAALSASLGYTLLHEDRALLGMGSSNSSDLPEGSTTDAATLGANLAFASDWSLAASGTLGRTRAGDPTRSNIAVGSGGVISSAYQFALTKQRVLDGRDRLRVTFAQPMHIERGAIDVSGVEVVDRETGELGVVVQHAEIGKPPRRHVAEMIYGRDVLDGAAEFSLFGRATFGARSSDQLPGVMAGGSFRLAF